MLADTNSTVMPPNTTQVKVDNGEYITLPYFVVDAFAHEPYKGNPATVVLCDKLVEYYDSLHAKKTPSYTQTAAQIMEAYSNLIPIHVLRSITHEICSVEVAFVFPLLPTCVQAKVLTDANANDLTSMYVVRFFTKTGEMPFCGHASFAAAHILLNVLPSISSSNKQKTGMMINMSQSTSTNCAAPSQVEFITKGNGIVQIRKCKVQSFSIHNNNDIKSNSNDYKAEESNASLMRNKNAQYSLSMLLNAGQIISTPSTVQLLARIKEVAANTINMLCSLGLVRSTSIDKTKNSNEDIEHKTKESNKTQIARQTAALIDTIQYESKTGNLIFILHNATSVLQAQPHFRELVQALQTKANSTTTGKDASHTNSNNNVIYFGDKVTRITLMARPTAEERNKRFITSAHMESTDNTHSTNAKPLQIDVRQVDFVLRLFAPWININEDALSANTQCALATYWAERLHVPCGSPLTSYQGSARGQALNLIVESKVDKVNKVRVEGTCVMIAQGIVTSPVAKSFVYNRAKL